MPEKYLDTFIKMNEQKGLSLCFRRGQHLVSVRLKAAHNGLFVTTCGHCRSQREQKRPRAEIERYVKDHIPDVGKVVANSFAKFREMYSGKGG
jgi:hypothetical protein